MTESTKSLTIYKASAGSGKTFTLSVAYIKLLIANPLAYRSTLAVTFTNKATAEMKTRILSQLYGIWKLLPSSRSYIDKIKTDLNISEEFMSQRAGIALQSIVNNYSYFRIETIDSFFQSVLRNLARELELTANLNIDLNDKEVEYRAVDEIIENLDEKSDVLSWILEYIQENINDDKSWNVFEHIKGFGLNIFKEFYKTNSERLNNIMSEKSFFRKYKESMHALANEAKAEMESAANEFFTALDMHGIGITDLKNNVKGVAGYFVKIKNGVYNDSIITATVQKAIDNTDDTSLWLRNDAPERLKKIVTDTLVPILLHTEEIRKRCWKTYGSAMLTMSNLNQLRLLNTIENKIREINVETNSFLLSDTHTLLHSLIKDNDSPFIFEKIGSRLENIMIDEFQDTSVIQWQNFKVLLEECMSHGENKGNLIVGDVKQSIYRWRSGDWRMLNNIEREFPLTKEMLQICTLDFNYRSERRIVEFNNEFFKRAALIEYQNEKNATQESNSGTILEPEQLQKAYDDVCQKVPNGKPYRGYVSIELYPKATDEELMHRTEERIRELLDKGAQPCDIAIILRKNDQISMVADYLTQAMPDIKFVSNEAFLLDSSIAVNIIINAMQCLVQPDDDIAKAYVTKAYATKVLGMEMEKVDDILANSDMANSLLPVEFIDKPTELLAMPLFELAEKLYTIFKLDKIYGEDAYIYKFYDAMSDFISNNTADTAAFLNCWEETLHSNTITAESTDGIRLISIHQSKGLEFKHVIMPFCDWQIYKNTTMIWSSPTEKPYSLLPLIPVELSSKNMKGTIYEADYTEEHLQTTVDHLNMLYVAFTRASSSLIVMGKRRNTTFRSNVVEKVISNMNLDGYTIEGDTADKNAVISLTYGEIYTDKKQKEGKSDNIFTPNIENIDSQLYTYDQTVEFKQSNKSQEFVDGDEDNDQSAYIKTGRILHELFSNIETADDVDPCVQELEAEGVLDESGLSAERIKKMIHKRLENATIGNWFSNKWQLFNECTILSVNPVTDKLEERRPDRVMRNGNNFVVVDFKFGCPKPEYIEQVRQYMTLIEGMGKYNVKGYLWYVYSNKIEEVK